MNNHLTKRTRQLLLYLLLCVSLLFRVEYIRETIFYSPIRSDAKQYVSYGYNLANKGIYSKELSEHPAPDSFRSPGYPLFLALSMKIAGKQFYPMILYWQAVIGAGVCLLTYLLGKKFMPFWGAYLSAFLVALSPHQVSLAGYVLTETLFGFLFLVAIYCFILMLEKPGLTNAATSGIIWGCVYLTNETALFFPYLLAMSHIFFFKDSIIQKKRIRIAMTFFLILFTLFPVFWSLRTELILPENAPKGSSRAISTMSHGAYPDFIYKNPRYRGLPYLEDPMQPEFGASIHNFLTILFKRAKERPLRYISWYMFEKPYYLWSWNMIQGQGDVFIYPVQISLFDKSSTAAFLKTTMKQIHPFVICLAFTGCFILTIKIILKRTDNNIIVIYLFLTLLYYTGLYTVFAPWPRYSIPFRPELYLFALWSLLQISNMKRKPGK